MRREIVVTRRAGVDNLGWSETVRTSKKNRNAYDLIAPSESVRLPYMAFITMSSVRAFLYEIAQKPA
jgi:hypothetical protein